MIGIVLLFYWDYRGLKITPDNNPFQHIAKTDCANLPHQDVHIVYITDENYIYPTQVSAYSAIKNKCPQSTYYFHIIVDGVNPHKAAQAFNPLASETVHFNIVPQKRAVDIDFSDYLKHISASALLKFIIPTALPNVDRAIFLDSDTLVTKDLQTLFTTELGDNLAGAVADIGITTQHAYLENLGYKEDVYYNAGVLLLDLAKMRQYNIPQQLNTYVQNNRHLVFWDQDAYNIILKKHIKTLPYIYNCAPILHLNDNPLPNFWHYFTKRIKRRKPSISPFMNLYASELPFFYRNTFKDVAIFHYFGVAKPWKEEEGTIKSIELYFNLWRQYAQDMQQQKHLSPRPISPIAIKRSKNHSTNTQ